MLPVLMFIGTQASMEEPTYDKAAGGPMKLILGD
jgi:hypothetical protein